jgi:hypothetical protein
MVEWLCVQRPRCELMKGDPSSRIVCHEWGAWISSCVIIERGYLCVKMALPLTIVVWPFTNCVVPSGLGGVLQVVIRQCEYALLWAAQLAS